MYHRATIILLLTWLVIQTVCTENSVKSPTTDQRVVREEIPTVKVQFTNTQYNAQAKLPCFHHASLHVGGGFNRPPAFVGVGFRFRF